MTSVIMAIVRLMLLNLTLLIRDVTSSCNVICTTDYATSLNCSCSCTVPFSQIQIEANCTDLEADVYGDCEIKPPHGWCLIKPENFSLITTIGTICTARVYQTISQQKIGVNDSITWRLENKVKPHPPFNLQVKKERGDFNISWDIQSIEGETSQDSEVRIRAKNDFSKALVRYPVEPQTCVTVYAVNLQPFTEYVVDVRTTLSNQSNYKGTWSEWSSTTEWRTGPGIHTRKHISDLQSYFFIPVMLVISFLVLWFACTRKPLFRYWAKKLQLIRNIPSPDEFFKPLYQTHNGNFKDWVRPIFSECDLAPITPLPLIDHKRQDISHWKRQVDHSDVAYEWTRNHGSGRCQPSSSSLLYFQEHTVNDTGHSSGLISIHTVLLSDDEGSNETKGGTFCGGSVEMAESKQNKSFKMDETFGLLVTRGKQSDMDWQPTDHSNESERSSLDSFNSNRRSEDGYPHVDLDTIDSGFGESDCSSPLNLDLNAEEPKSTSVFKGEGSSSSNYVKQWTICANAPNDASN